MDTNIRFIEPNMSIYEAGGEELFYNITYKNSSIPNSLIVKDSNGGVIRTYPLSLNLDYQVISLVFDGFYFWSLQRITSTYGVLQGSVIRKWEINSEDTQLIHLKQQTFWNTADLKYDLSALAVEYYNLELIESIIAGMNVIKCRYPEDYEPILRLREDDIVVVGPNNLGQYFEGTVSYTETYEHPTNGYCRIIFKNYIDNSFLVENNCFCGTRLWVFNNYSTNLYRGSLYELDLNTISVINTWESCLFKNVKCSTFHIVDNIDRINAGNKVLSLLYRVNHILVIADVTDPTNTQMTMILPDNHKDYNDYILSYSIYLKHNPFDVLDNPQLYSLQIGYRDVTYGYQTFSTYNYLTFKLDYYPSFMSLMMDPMIVMASGIGNIRCHLIDQYDFPIQAGINVHWDTDGDGTLLGWPGNLDLNDIPTDENGISYNRLRAGTSMGYYNVSTSTIVT